MTMLLQNAFQVLRADENLAQLTENAISTAPRDDSVRAAVLCHLAQPSTLATALATGLDGGLDTVRAAYRVCREAPAISQLISSAYYPHRLRWAFAAATVQQWRRSPERPARIRARQAVLSDTVEIHPTRGTCNYGCVMCLWSDQKHLTYATKNLDTDGLMTTSEWIRVLHDLRDNDVSRLVVSGGGEALLNPDLPTILDTAADLQFEIHVYTTGFSIRPGTRLFHALLRCHRIRFSIHSPDPRTYDHIARTRPKQRALERVTANLVALLDERDSDLAVGIGFVIQPDNHQQITDMAEFAHNLGADWLDLRKDEVDVTDGLTVDQLELIRAQLRTVRNNPPPHTRIDIADELVAVANGQPIDRIRTDECLGRYFRPTIGAYGHLTPCDLKAEPRFAQTGYDLGSVKRSRILEVVSTSAYQRIPDDCAQCMPSSRTGNRMVHKLLADLDAGIGIDEQSFA
ncbi:radical SAM/SPASM domain-containing protein [Nocardia abscessus]|uniref:radical SAM/SPASM domain-containing protein n=1 Tax=Nocardia abscessus TaxID=120957 RepID=UPI002458028B|nr:radical SAM protein [Nocardia abscessus]